MNGKRFEIFKIFGFPIRVDATWLLIFFFVTYSLASGFFPVNHPGLPTIAYWAMAFLGANGLFASILFHELAHSLVARHYDIKIDGITLFIFGGVAEMREEPASPKIEFLMAVVGPLASALLAGAFFGLFYLTESTELNRGAILIFYYLGFMNAMLAAFNLVPAFPLDGGRIFRAVLWAIKKNYAWATRVAGRVGQGFGWLMIAYGAFKILQKDVFGGMWAILIGFFIKQASQASMKQLDLKKILEGSDVGPAVQTQFVSLTPTNPLFTLAPALEGKNLLSHYPVIEDGVLVGYLSLTQLQDLSGEKWETLRVKDLYERDFRRLVVDAQRSAYEAFEKMRSEHSSNLFVLQGDQICGIVTAQALMELVQGKLSNPL